MAEVTEQVIHDIMTPVIKLGVTAQEIDDAVNRAKTGGVIDALIAEKAPDGLISETNGFATAEAEDAWLLSVISGMKNDTAKLVRSYHQTNISPFGGGYYQYFIYKATSSYAVIEMKHYGSANGAVLGLRTLYNGNLSPWAWNNPPMQLGVEYRTTEFYLGKPVYKKAVPINALPVSAAGNVYVSPENAETGLIPVGVESVRAYDSSNDYYIEILNAGTDFGIDEITLSRVKTEQYPLGCLRFTIITTKDRSPYSAVAVAKYTKTTD